MKTLFFALLLLLAFACIKDEYNTWRCKPYAVRYVSGAKCPDTLRFKTMYYPSLTNSEMNTVIRQSQFETREVIGTDTVTTTYHYPCGMVICP